MKKLRNALIAAFSVTAGVFLLNAIIITLSQPSLGDPVDFASTERFNLILDGQEVTVVAVDNLQSGGVPGFTFEAAGYVNALQEENVIYINPTDLPDSSMVFTYLLTHEYGHIEQKELIAQVSGGYPSYWNPITSAIFYYNTLRLNTELEPYAHDFQDSVHEEHGFMPFNNIESNADCYVQGEGIWPFEYSYIGYEFCTYEQLGASYAIANGEWPTEEVVSGYVTQIENGTLIPYRVDKEKGTGGVESKEAGKIIGGLDKLDDKE